MIIPQRWDIEHAKKIITKMLEEPPSQQLLDELEEARGFNAKQFISNEEDFDKLIKSSEQSFEVA